MGAEWETKADSIEGFVEHIIYHNAENGYVVLSLADEDGDEVTCTGHLPSPQEGVFLELSGRYVDHPTYGRQFAFREAKIRTPKDTLSIERYLGSGAIKGIGPKLAALIVKKFGEETFLIMEEEPERLAEVRGISEKKARDISAQMEAQRDLREAMVFLQEYGISGKLAIKIYDRYGQNLYSVISKNPYRLADDLSGVGFKIADEIASRVGIRADSDFRIQSGIHYTLTSAAQEGHLYLPYEELAERLKALLGFAVNDLSVHLSNLVVDGRVVIKELDGVQAIYPASYYHLEWGVAVRLMNLNQRWEVDEEELREKLLRLEEEEGVALDELQRHACIEALRNNLLILTGGPGTGKTTTINMMIRLLREEGLGVALAAPTGRAAKRMTETTGCEAQTIHRLLEVNVVGDDEDMSRPRFQYNGDNPLETDAIIIDETSMVDIYLLHSLLQAVTEDTHLIFVGDKDQLPSVGPGAVLRDMIESEAIPVIALTKIFRQETISDIVVNAHKINRGEAVTLDNKSKDFFFLARSDADTIIAHMGILIREKLPPYLGVEPIDIQVLTPMRKGPLGAIRLNQVLQHYLNPPSSQKTEKETPQGILREGDKVMQIRNNYQLEWRIYNAFDIPVEEGSGVFNGDLGRVETIDNSAEVVTVIFDDERRVIYTFDDLEELELAYAITVHKSQGSEYPAVLLPLLNGPPLLFHRNLLYTAVTRAQRLVAVLGSEKTFQEMIQNEQELARYTGLRYFLGHSVPQTLPGLP